MSEVRVAVQACVDGGDRPKSTCKPHTEDVELEEPCVGRLATAVAHEGVIDDTKEKWKRAGG